MLCDADSTVLAFNESVILLRALPVSEVTVHSTDVQSRPPPPCDAPYDKVRSSHTDNSLGACKLTTGAFNHDSSGRVDSSGGSTVTVAPTLYTYELQSKPFAHAA